MGLFFLEEPPCSQESVNVCPRRLLLLPQPRSRLRLWLPQRESTLCGLEEVFWLLCLHSKVCGSPRKNTTNLVPLLSTASASKQAACFIRTFFHACFVCARSIICAVDSVIFS